MYKLICWHVQIRSNNLNNSNNFKIIGLSIHIQNPKDLPTLLNRSYHKYFIFILPFLFNKIYPGKERRLASSRPSIRTTTKLSSVMGTSPVFLICLCLLSSICYVSVSADEHNHKVCLYLYLCLWLHASVVYVLILLYIYNATHSCSIMTEKKLYYGWTRSVPITIARRRMRISRCPSAVVPSRVYLITMKL